MRARLRNLSFRNKLLLAFLLIGVVPLLISTLLMLNIFRVTLAGNARDAAQAELDGAVRALDTLLGEGVETLHDLAGDGLVCAELSEPGSQPPQSVYDALYTLSSGLRGQADFALYSAQGELLFTTGTGSAAELGTHWGLLNAAAPDDVRAQGLGRVRLHLRPAAADGARRAGIVLHEPPQRLAGFPPALRRHGAAVHDDEFGALPLPRRLMAALAQEGLHGLGLILVDLAA